MRSSEIYEVPGRALLVSFKLQTAEYKPRLCCGTYDDISRLLVAAASDSLVCGTCGTCSSCGIHATTVDLLWKNPMESCGGRGGRVSLWVAGLKKGEGFRRLGVLSFFFFLDVDCSLSASVCFFVHFFFLPRSLPSSFSTFCSSFSSWRSLSDSSLTRSTSLGSAAEI